MLNVTERYWEKKTQGWENMKPSFNVSLSRAAFSQNENENIESSIKKILKTVSAQKFENNENNSAINPFHNGTPLIDDASSVHRSFVSLDESLLLQDVESLFNRVLVPHQGLLVVLTLSLELQGVQEDVGSVVPLKQQNNLVKNQTELKSSFRP